MTTERATATVPACIEGGAHHWLLESPSPESGGIVGAACVRCGVARTYSTPDPGDYFRRYPSPALPTVLSRRCEVRLADEWDGDAA